SGPPVLLPPGLATPLGLVIHELGTNAIKHGALSRPEGSVDLSWRTRMPNGGTTELELVWRERGGHPVTEEPKSGFGAKLIETCLSEARIHRDWQKDGLVCTIQVPLRLAPEPLAEVNQARRYPAPE